MTKSLADRFWAKVVVLSADECWLWTGPAKGGGHYTKYGYMWNGKEKEGVHRVSYRIHHGGIPDGLAVLHRCDVPTCVNPAHLFLGTQAENMDDMWRKGRGAQGERSGGAKLTEAWVKEIRARVARGQPKAAVARDVAAESGVSQFTIISVLYGASWRHVS